MQSLRRLLTLLARPITDNAVFYLSVLMLQAVSVVSIVYAGCSRQLAGLELFADLYMLCLLTMIVPRQWRRGVQTAIFIVLWLIGVADMLCYVTMGIAMTPNVLTTWLQTDGREASEVIRGHADLQLLLSPILPLLIVPCVALWLRRIHIPTPQWLSRALLALTLVSAVVGFNNKLYLLQTWLRTSDDDTKDFIVVESHTLEYLPVYRLVYSLKEVSRFSHMVERLKAGISQTTVDSCTFRSPRIVLIIGESYNRHHASLYGYPLPTTPLQQQRADSDSLAVFTDVVSSYNLTFKSFQNMLSLYDYDSPGQWYDYPLLPVMLRRAGYEVSFLSNQMCLDKRSSYSNFIEDIFINNPALSIHMFDHRNPAIHPLDLELIDEYRTVEPQLNDSARFTIFHFIGLHEEFELRRSADYERFHATDYDRPELSTQQRQVIADYDNAMLYNDFVLDSIIRVFEHEDCIIVHVPDHGELVYDGCTRYGRDFSLDPSVVHPQFDIPFWIYCTPTYRQQHPDVWTRVQRATQRPFMTDDLPHLLLYLAGIHTPHYDSRRNVLSDDFNENRVRRICGERDYQ